MTWLDDFRSGPTRVGERLEAAVESARRWAASEVGQEVLMGVDFLTLSTRVCDFYAHVGWYMPVHPSLLRYALERREFQVPWDARDAARCVGPGSSHWAWIAEGTLTSPVLQSRRPVVEDAVFCMESGRWYAAISTLLPIIEGVVSDRSGVLEGMRVGRRVDEMLYSEEGEWIALSAVAPLGVLDAEVFDRRHFSKVAIAEDALNRHLVLHGRIAGFGTRINAVRAFMLLVALVEVVDGPVLLRASAVPVDEGSFLDDYGPLAELRAAARKAA